MPVIINEFEIVTPPASSTRGQAEPPAAQGQGPAALRPTEIRRIEEHYRKRAARLRAD